MREIKFRMWDPSKKMIKFDAYPGAYPGTYFLNMWLYQIQKSGDILMQYTGQKDKNGKEIYEGDIIKQYSLPDYKEPLEDVALVFWSECDARFSLNWLEGAYVQYNNIYWYSYEVIGNIYENPEITIEIRDNPHA